MSNKLMHIYGPQHEHDSVFLVGNTEALQELRDAIDQVLREPYASVKIDLMVADGEGFDIVIIRKDKERSWWINLALPYSDEITRYGPGSSQLKRPANIIDPWDLEGVKALYEKEER